jgi:hypothetical protein
MTLRTGGIALVAILVSVGCSSDIELGRDLGSAMSKGGSAGSAGAGGSGVGGTSGTSGTGGGECQVTLCQGKGYACGNCLDDDEDGAVDSDDIYCTGPCDNSESSFAIDIRGGAGPVCKQDCFFDSDVGSGNDGCNWSHTCDPVAVAPDYPPSGDSACAYDENAPIPGMAASCADVRSAQEPMCADTCGPLVPNGCDCFGCCELPAASGRFVWLGSESAGSSGCTEEGLDDPSVCHPCTQVPSCVNPCDPCEICVGRTAPDPSCMSGGVPTCPTGMATCGVEDGPRCSSGAYCITGCCVPEPR